jgi:cullin 1
MIAKLTLQCGTNFTSKLEGMLADLAVGINKHNEFQLMFRKKQLKTSYPLDIGQLTQVLMFH